MIKIFSAVLSALVILLCIAPVTVYAADTDYFTDYDDTKLNPVNNSVVSIKHILQGAQDYHNGNITADEFVNNVLVTAKNGADANLTGLINSAVDSYNSAGAITRGFWDNLINGINGVITSNGGNVSGFPSGNTTVSAGQGYIVFEPYTAWYVFTDGASRYEIYATVYYNNGTVAVPKKRVYNTNPQKNNILDNGGGILSIYFDRTLDMDSGGTRFFMFSDCYEWGYPNAQTVSFSVDVPWTVGDGTVDTTNLTPDVGVLSDDDLYKYIDKLINNLDNTYPDLSTVEGKLQEIINLLNKTKDGGCSCDELAAAIRELISRLDNSGSDTELNNTLKELVKKLENNQDLSSVIDKIEELRKDLLKAYAFDYTDKDIKTVISKYNDFSDYLINKKFAFVGSLTSIINTAVDSYKKSGDNSMFTVTFNGSSHTIDLAGAFSSDQLDVFRYMIAAFIYVQFALSVYRRIPSYINNGGDR